MPGTGLNERAEMSESEEEWDLNECFERTSEYHYSILHNFS